MEFDELPQPEFEGYMDPSELEFDGQNPNWMDANMFDLLKDRIKNRGWLGNAVIIDSDGVVADGEHRTRAARELGLDEIPVKQYDLTKEERKVLRQELNKISGKHDPEADAVEFEEILDTEEESDLIDLLDARNEDIDSLLEPDSHEDFFEEEEQDYDGIAFKQECPECGHEWFEEPT